MPRQKMMASSNISLDIQPKGYKKINDDGRSHGEEG
jgi:hypothetical protein